MKNILFTIMLIVSFAATAFAVPSLQVGVRDGLGGWVLNGPNPLTGPTENDTAVTTGNSISVAAVYGNGDLFIGGQYNATTNDWSDFSQGGGPNAVNLPTQFNGKGALLVASVQDGKLADAAGLMVNGFLAIHTDTTESWLPNPPSNHDPAKGNISDFLFFDLGNFSMTANENVPDFQGGGSALGDIMDLTLSGMGNLDWIHFDVMAIVTGTQGQNIVSNTAGNPGSHDVTWKKDDGGVFPPAAVVPEPSTILLLGAGLVGLGFYGRRKRS